MTRHRDSGRRVSGQSPTANTRALCVHDAAAGTATSLSPSADVDPSSDSSRAISRRSGCIAVSLHSSWMSDPENPCPRARGRRYYVFRQSPTKSASAQRRGWRHSNTNITRAQEHAPQSLPPKMHSPDPARCRVLVAGASGSSARAPWHQEAAPAHASRVAAALPRQAPREDCWPLAGKRDHQSCSSRPSAGASDAMRQCVKARCQANRARHTAHNTTHVPGRKQSHRSKRTHTPHLYQQLRLHAPACFVLRAPL